MLTCHLCPRQIAFRGSKRDLFARLFGWVIKGGRYFCSPSCAERQP